MAIGPLSLRRPNKSSRSASARSYVLPGENRRRREGGGLIGGSRAPVPSPAPPVPPSPAGKESSYVLLGEDLLLSHGVKRSGGGWEGGGSQQQHPEQSVGEIRKLHHGPVGHALNQRLIVEYRLVQGHLQATILEEGKLSALLLLVGTTHPCSLRSLSPPTALRRLRSAGGASPSLPGKESSYVLLGGGPPERSEGEEGEA
jgi:hypothetical protein